MSEQNDLERMELLKFTSEIIVAKVGASHVAVEALPSLIRDVYAALAGQANKDKEVVQQRQQPAVPVRKSVFPDYIICLEDGKKLKMLKRHLKSTYGLMPDQYRAKWGLPSDYPLVAPNYAKRRSALAREIGLGRSVGSMGESRRRNQQETEE